MEGRRWDERHRERERAGNGKGREWSDDVQYEYDRKGKGKEREVSIPVPDEEGERERDRNFESSRGRRRGRPVRSGDHDTDVDEDDGVRKRRRKGEDIGKGKGKERAVEGDEDTDRDKGSRKGKSAHRVRVGESKSAGDPSRAGSSETGLSVGCESVRGQERSGWDGASAKVRGDVNAHGNEEGKSEFKLGPDEMLLGRKGTGKGHKVADLADVGVDVEMADGEPPATVDPPVHPQPRRTRQRYTNLLQSVQAHLDIDIGHGSPRRAIIPSSRSKEDAGHAKTLGSVPNPNPLLGRLSNHYVNAEIPPLSRYRGLPLSSSASVSAPPTTPTSTSISTPSRTYPRNDDGSVINITVKNGLTVNGESISISSYDETGLSKNTTTTTMKTDLGMPSQKLTSSRMSAPDIMARTRARMRLADLNTATVTVAATSLSPGRQEGSDNDKSQSASLYAPASLSSSGPTNTANPLTSQEIMKRTRARLAQMKDKKENSSRSPSALTVPSSVSSVGLGSNTDETVNHTESPRAPSSKTAGNQACGTETETLPQFGRGHIKGLTSSESHAGALEEREHRSSLYPGPGLSHEFDLRLRLLSRLEEERRENANMAVLASTSTAHEDETHGQDDSRAVNSNALLVSVPNIPSDLATDPQEKERKLRARAQLRVRLTAAKKAVTQLQV